MEAYVQASNLFTLTKYNGLDPEISVGGIDAGVDASQWPNTRQIVFGIRLDI
jgi:iron complex outermembrane receptor protein